MSFFRPDPIGPNGERNRLKITSSYALVQRARNDLCTVQVNIPSQYLIDGVILNHMPQLVQWIRVQSGLDIAIHRPLIGIEATFILRSKTNPSLQRVFAGSVQRANQLFNQIASPREIRSVNQLRLFVGEHISPALLAQKLDSNAVCPDSDWAFEAVVSVVLNINARVRLPPPMRRFKKIFYEL